MTRAQAAELKRQVLARLRSGSAPAEELRKVGARMPAKKARKRRA
jgi:hypothetical protein